MLYKRKIKQTNKQKRDKKITMLALTIFLLSRTTLFLQEGSEVTVHVFELLNVDWATVS